MDLSEASADLLELVSLVIRGVSNNRDMSLTALSVLGSVGRLGPRRITALAASEGVSQPSMTQLIQRDPAVRRIRTPGDQPANDEGRAAVAARRARSASRIAGLLADLPENDVQSLHHALRAVLPAIRRQVGGDARVVGSRAGR